MILLCLANLIMNNSRAWMLRRRLNSVAEAAPELNMIIPTGERLYTSLYSHRWSCYHTLVNMIAHIPVDDWAAAECGDSSSM